MKNIDSAIKREFDALGFNVVDNQNLADLIIARSRRNLIRRILISALALLGLSVTIFLLILTLNKSEVLPKINSTSATTVSTSPEVSPLPLYSTIDIDGSKPSLSQASFQFDLEGGQMIEFVTHIPLAPPGVMGKLVVFLRSGNGDYREVMNYEIGSFTNIQEFGVPQSGRYKFELAISQPTYVGRIRVLIARGQ